MEGRTRAGAFGVISFVTGLRESAHILHDILNGCKIECFMLDHNIQYTSRISLAVDRLTPWDGPTYLDG